jgi:DNA-binding response OmpR family regulator
MQVLIAEDDPIALRLIEAGLQRAGYEVISCKDGAQAWAILQAPDPPRLVVLDWMMPGLDGVEICFRLRQREDIGYVYTILLTSRSRPEDLAAGMEGGADDYMIKPLELQELLYRLRVGERILKLERALNERIRELQESLAHVKQLQGLIPICMHCKRIRDDQNVWHQLEAYIQQHSSAMLTHSLCLECRDLYYPEFAPGP